jgi:hypothetical protein
LGFPGYLELLDSIPSIDNSVQAVIYTSCAVQHTHKSVAKGAPTPMSTPKGKFSWYELMTTDTEAAKAFYESVVGWTTTDVGSPEMPYSSFNVKGVGIAGLMSLPKEAGPIPAWIGYIHVDDVDEYAARLVEAGGTIHRPPTDVPGMLRFTVVIDAQGAPLVLFTANPSMASPPTRPAMGDPGTIAWHELMATDGAAAFDFYVKQFGWTEGPVHDMGPMGLYRMFDVDGKTEGGIMTRPPGVPGPFWNFYIQVEGAKEAVSRIEAGGGKVLNGPHQVPTGGWIVQAVDPQGANFFLVSGTL